MGIAGGAFITHMAVDDPFGLDLPQRLVVGLTDLARAVDGTLQNCPVGIAAHALDRGQAGAVRHQDANAVDKA